MENRLVELVIFGIEVLNPNFKIISYAASTMNWQSGIQTKIFTYGIVNDYSWLVHKKGLGYSSKQTPKKSRRPVNGNQCNESICFVRWILECWSNHIHIYLLASASFTGILLAPRLFCVFWICPLLFYPLCETCTGHIRIQITEWLPQEHDWSSWHWTVNNCRTQVSHGAFYLCCFESIAGNYETDVRIFEIILDDNGLFILYGRYHGCWRFDYIRGEGMISYNSYHGVVCLRYQSNLPVWSIFRSQGSAIILWFFLIKTTV